MPEAGEHPDVAGLLWASPRLRVAVFARRVRGERPRGSALDAVRKRRAVDVADRTRAPCDIPGERRRISQNSNAGGPMITRPVQTMTINAVAMLGLWRRGGPAMIDSFSIGGA